MVTNNNAYDSRNYLIFYVLFYQVNVLLLSNHPCTARKAPPKLEQKKKKKKINATLISPSVLSLATNKTPLSLSNQNRKHLSKKQKGNDE